MANVPFSRLYDQVLPYLPGAEPAIVDSQIRKVLREFMKRTTICRQSFYLTTVAGVSAYRLEPTFGQVSSVLHVWQDCGSPLPNVPEEMLAPAADARPRGWYTLVPHIINLYPRPNAAYCYVVDAVITLKQDDTQFPEELAEQYSEALAAGVLSMMYSMPGKPWSQPDAARASGRVYSGVIQSIRSSLRDGGRPNQSTFRGIVRFGA